MTKDEALKLALEALGNTWTEPKSEQYKIEKEAITAIKEALAHPEHEPVAWQFMKGSNFRKHRPDDFDDLASDGLPYWKPLYTTPPQREFVGLTYEEKHAIRYSHMTSAEFIEVIEAKLKERNT